MPPPRPRAPAPHRLDELLDGTPRLLGVVTGTELLRRGVDTGLPLWSAGALMSDPLTVAAIHRDHVLAGASIVVANTFRTDRRTLTRAGIADEAAAWTRRAVQLARSGVQARASGGTVLVAGSVSPLEDCYRPDLVPDDATLRREHAFRIRDLLRASADLALVETMNTIREAVAALGACRAGNLPSVVAFTLDEQARLRSGESLAEAVQAVLPLGPQAVLVNCCSVDAASRGLQILAEVCPLPRGAYANGQGCPDDRQGWRFEGSGTSRDVYRDAVRRWIESGATLVGGCCGTAPDWLSGVLD